jgi:hypothetical protein
VKVTTKAVFDIETLDLLHWEGYEYDGPVALCGKLFANLTKSGVVQPSGSTTYYDSPQDATIAASKQLPSAAAMLGPDVMNPNMAPPANVPTVSTPTFAEAQDKPGALTTKGRALSLILSGIEGAAVGDAAARQGSPRTGYPGASAGAVAGLRLPFEQAQQRNELAAEQLQQQKTQAEIAALPQQQAAERAHLVAQTNLANANAARKDNYVIPGVGLVDSSGGVIVPEPSLGAKSQAEIAVKKTEAASAGLDPEQTLQYVYGIKPTPQNVDQQELNDWMQKNPGKGPSDFLKYKSTIVPAFNFNLQQGGVGNGSNFPPGTSPDEMYKSFGAKAGVIRGIVEGRQSPPSAFAQKTPYWQDVMEKVYQVDPNWNEQTAQLRKSYSSGKQSTEINSINTALGHVGVLGDSIAALNNGDVKQLNAIANQLGVQTGKTAVTTFNTIVHRVGPELAKAYIGSGGSAGERGSDEKDFDPNLGPKQLAANVGITARLLRSKIGSLENQWNQNAAPGMKSFQDQFITPEAKTALAKYSPQGGLIQVTAPDGSVHTFPNQASANTFKKLAGIQ